MDLHGFFDRSCQTTNTVKLNKFRVVFGQMPYPFTLSTTSHHSFQDNFTSSTHASLPSTATWHRNVIRSTLKSHKRLSPENQAINLSSVLSALDTYLRYIDTLDLALCGSLVNGEDVDLALTHEVELEWRPTLSSVAIPGRDIERVKGRGLDYELFFVYQTYATVQTLLARQALMGLYASTVPSTEQRLGLIQTAIRHLKIAYGVHEFLVEKANNGDGPPELPKGAVDVAPAVQHALQRVTQAECNLLGAFKDDPYPGIVVQARNENDREWMIRAPEIPKTRAAVLSRLCFGAAEHASAAAAILKNEKRVSKDFVEYVDDMKRTARARACRFQAIAADTDGQTGKGIAWIYAGLSELGFEVSLKDGSGKIGGFSKMKASWNERKEDKRLGKGSARWGSDAGKAEEARILDYLEKKLTKTNDSVFHHTVPAYKALLSSLPSGMNMPLGDAKWMLPILTEDELVQMRAPPDHVLVEQDSSGEDDEDKFGGRGPVGAFPGTNLQYKDSYY